MDELGIAVGMWMSMTAVFPFSENLLCIAAWNGGTCQAFPYLLAFLPWLFAYLLLFYLCYA
jgi:hypothetical protein